MEQFYRADQLGVRIYQFIAEAGRNLATLPFPMDGKCPSCGTFDDFHLVEFGYTRYTAVSLDVDMVDDRCSETGVRGTRCTLPVGHFEDCDFEGDVIVVEADDEDDAPVTVRGITATTDGWDDMSEDGALTTLVCRHCDSIIATPADIEIDYC